MTDELVLSRLSAVDVALTRMDIQARTMFIDYFDLRELIKQLDRAEPAYEPADTYLKGVKAALREGNREDALNYLNKWLMSVMLRVQWHGKSKAEVKSQLRVIFPEPTPDPNGITAWYEMMDVAAGVLSGEVWQLDRRVVGDIVRAAHLMNVGRYRLEFGSVGQLAAGIYLGRSEEATMAWDRMFEYLADLMHTKNASTRRWLADSIMNAAALLEKLEPFRLVLPPSPSELADLHRVRAWSLQRKSRTRT